MNIAFSKSLSNAVLTPLFSDSSYEFKKIDLPQEIFTSFASSEIDAAILSLPAACYFYQLSKGELLCAGITQEIDLYCLSSEEKCRDIADLLGKKVFASDSDFERALLTFLFKENDFPIVKGKGGITIEFMKNEGEVFNSFVNKPSSNVFLSENAYANALKYPSYHTVFSVKTEINSILGDTYLVPKNLLIVRKSFYQQYPQKIEKLCNDLEAAVIQVRERSWEYAEIFQNFTRSFDFINFTASFTTSNFTFNNSEMMNDSVLELLEIYNQTSREKIKRPDKSFFINP